MYLSKIEIGNSRDWLRRICQSGTRDALFREHQFIWGLFDNTPDQKRDFLYRREDQPGRPPFFYLLSQRQPLQDHADLNIQPRSFEPRLKTGDRLRFSLRANAVITRKADDHSKRRIRRDIIDAKVDEYKARFSDPDDRPPPSVIHQEAAEDWLTHQGQRHGFRIETLWVENHSYHRVRKPGDDNTRRFASLDLHGELTVDDPEAMVEALKTGLGRSKAFGCGLLLVRRA